MEISITNIIYESDKVFIHFTSSIGQGRGVWKSKNKPKFSSRYHVEFDVDENLIWSDNVMKVENTQSLIELLDENKIKLQGKIEAIKDSGNICFMRLDNSLFMFSCANIPDDFQGYVAITAQTLGIYDMNLWLLPRLDDEIRLCIGGMTEIGQSPCFGDGLQNGIM